MGKSGFLKLDHVCKDEHHQTFSCFTANLQTNLNSLYLKNASILNSFIACQGSNEFMSKTFIERTLAKSQDKMVVKGIGF